jgi:homoserine O-acetyltransferase
MTAHEYSHPERILLNSGQSLPDIRVAYHTFGELNADKSNVVLICHPLTADSNPLNWWGAIVGPNKAIDTNRYFVLCSNVLGGCYGTTGPSSINPKTGTPYGLSFPIITIRDMVTVQRHLCDHLGIERIHMVIGGSMGGMQALEWVAQCPDRVHACVSIAATSQVSPLAIAFDSVGRHAILNDLVTHTSGPSSGLAIARQLGHITYLSEEALEAKFSRQLQDADAFQYHMAPEFQVESYLSYQGNKFVNRFDPYAYLYLTKAISYFDLAHHYGSIEAALGPSHASFLIMAIRSDWLYTSKQSKTLVYELMKQNKHVSFVEIDSDYGHDTFLIDSDETRAVIHGFLDSL